MNKLLGNSDSERTHCVHNRWYWEGHHDQQSDWFLKLIPLLQVSLVTWRSLLVAVVSKMCVAGWLGCFRTALFRAHCLSLTFCGKCFATTQTLTFWVIIPQTSLYKVNTMDIKMPLLLTKLLLCSQQTLPSESSYVWIFMFFQKMKITQKNSQSTKSLMQQMTNG